MEISWGIVKFSLTLGRRIRGAYGRYLLCEIRRIGYCALALLATQIVFAEDRLRIEVLPVYIIWSTMACTVWSHLNTPTIARELGQYFGLDHKGTGDANFDGSDNTIDLTYEFYTATRTVGLKASNQARAHQHFGDTENDSFGAS